jgi:hypothetical protein
MAGVGLGRAVVLRVGRRAQQVLRRGAVAAALGLAPLSAQALDPSSPPPLLSSNAAAVAALKVPPAPAASTNSARLAELMGSPELQERITSFTFNPDVKVRLNLPSEASFAPGKKVMLIFYALPNGNRTPEAAGRAIQSKAEWRYDMQHIAAQTRFLRGLLKDRTVVVAYLETRQESWPAWRKAHGDKLLPDLVAALKKPFASHPVEVVLSAHSGGGSFIFGYLNAVERIPAEVTRMAFLDSNYAYDRALHEVKLIKWLAGAGNHYLCVLAADDPAAMIAGKPVGAGADGTWAKSHAMQQDLTTSFKFTAQTNADFQRYTALDGRVEFILKENPEKKVLHTVQVELNGFIQGMVSGTPNEGKGYQYFGPRAYTRWIRGE